MLCFYASVHQLDVNISLHGTLPARTCVVSLLLEAPFSPASAAASTGLNDWDFTPRVASCGVLLPDLGCTAVPSS